MAIYVKTAWSNNITPLNEGNMNHIEDGIYAVSTESFASCEANYSSNKLSLVFKNAGAETLGNPIEVTIPTGNAIVSISHNSTSKVLSYTDRDGTSTSIMNVYSTSDVYTKSEIDTAFQSYYTKTQIDNTLANYYTKTEIDTTLDSYYTKSEIDTTLGDYYTKAEINTCFTEVTVDPD